MHRKTKEREVAFVAYESTGETIREIRKSRNMNQDQLAELASLNRVTIAKYESGKVEPGAHALSRLADALDVSVDEILGRKEKGSLPYGFSSIVRNAVPLVGEIACGTPILAQENIETSIDVPDGVRADFALRCKGASMEPLFLDGDLVLIRQQDDADDGKIAAVLIDNEATLKRIHRIPGGLMLLPENTEKFAPQIYQGETATAIRILGIAVGYVRMI